MRIRILVHTPKGNAKSTRDLLAKFILLHHRPDKTGVSKNDDSFYWEIEADPKGAARIQRNVIVWEHLVHGILDAKLLKRYAQRSMSPGSLDELRDMLQKKTTIRIIRSQEADTPTPEGPSLWERIKRTFKD